MTLTTKETMPDYRKAYNEYQRCWRKANRDKVREYHKRYWQKVAERIKAEATS